MNPITLLIVAAVAVAIASGPVVGDSDPAPARPCMLDDYVPQFGACTDGTRMVTYARPETTLCSGPAVLHGNGTDGVVETCKCTVQDYMPVFSNCSNGVRSLLRYERTSECESDGGVKPPRTPVDDLPCVCTADDILSMYTHCDFSTGSRSVIYYYRQHLDRPACIAPGPSDDAPDSVRARLPAPQLLACNLTCAAGQYLQPPHTECQTCAAGHYSFGGGESFSHFTTLPPGFTTGCQSHQHSAAPGTACTPWHAEDGVLVSGDQLVNGTKQHALDSWLQWAADLVHGGAFVITFRVDAERAGAVPYDGLTIWIDDEPVTNLTAYVFHYTTLRIPLDPGVHEGRLVYSKDSAITMGEDRAVLRRLDILGTAYFAEQCSVCPAGTAPNSAGSDCDPCPPGTFAATDGSERCQPCPNPDREYSLSGATECLPRPICRAQDATQYYTPCRAGRQSLVHTWIAPPTCRVGRVGVDHGPSGDGDPFQLPANATDLACERCPPGMRRLIGGDGQCVSCDGNERYDEDSDSCVPCGPGKFAPRTLELSDFHLWGSDLPPGASTGCLGDCAIGDGWLVAFNRTDGHRTYLSASAGSAALGLGPSTQQFLLWNVTLATAGTIKFRGEITGYTATFAFAVNGETDGSMWYGELSGTFEHESRLLAAGEHQFMWTFLRENSYATLSTEDGGEGSDEDFDEVKITWIRITGVRGGGSVTCEDCPSGSICPTDAETPIPCPAGQQPDPATNFTRCGACPGDSYSPAEGSGPCVPCGTGTRPQPGARDCGLGGFQDGSAGATGCGFTRRVLIHPSPSRSVSLSPSRSVAPSVSSSAGAVDPSATPTHSPHRDSEEESAADADADADPQLPGRRRLHAAAGRRELLDDPVVSPSQAAPSPSQAAVPVTPSVSVSKSVAPSLSKSPAAPSATPSVSATPLFTEYRFNLSAIADKDTITYMWGPLVDRLNNSFFLSVCGGRDQSAAVCGLDVDGNPLRTLACSRLTSGHSVDIGNQIEVLPLPDSYDNAAIATASTDSVWEWALGTAPPMIFSDAESIRRGFVVRLTGGTPCSSGVHRSTNITMLCNPQAGKGFPALEEPFESPVCSYHFRWETAMACAECTQEADYERIVVPCNADARRTVRWTRRAESRCAGGYTPPDAVTEVCKACDRDEDFQFEDSSCVGGIRTRHWHVRPGVSCDDALDVLPGPEQFPCSDYSIERGFANVVLGIVAVFLLVVLGSMVVLFVKNRRLRSEYSILSSGGGGGSTRRPSGNSSGGGGGGGGFRQSSGNQSGGGRHALIGMDDAFSMEGDPEFDDDHLGLDLDDDVPAGPANKGRVGGANLAPMSTAKRSSRFGGNRMANL